MVVGYFHILGLPVHPAKADAKLIVDADRVLTRTVASQRLKPVAWRRLQVLFFGGIFDNEQLPLG